MVLILISSLLLTTVADTASGKPLARVMLLVMKLHSLGSAANSVELELVAVCVTP